jgi:hypothetical protein
LHIFLLYFQVKDYLYDRAGKWKNYTVSTSARKLQREEADALHKLSEYGEHSRRRESHFRSEIDYDRTRRRNAFSILPGFQEKPEMDSVRFCWSKKCNFQKVIPPSRNDLFSLPFLFFGK